VRTLFGDPNRDPEIIRQDLRSVYDGFLGLRDLAIPTIAAVHGLAVGAGVNIALACDVIVVDPSARFVVSFAEIGLHPGGGCSWFLARQLGPRRAMDVILGARTIDARAAVELGMAVQMADDVGTAALSLAEQYAARDIQLLRDMKRAVRLAEEQDLERVLEVESRAQAASVNRPPFQAYLNSFAR
jgi:enoyl-CoA hydratase